MPVIEKTNEQLAKLVGGKHWNVVSQDNGDGTITAEIHGKWVNYLDTFDEWRAINCNIVQEADGFHVTDAPFNFYAPLKADGEAFFESDVRWDIFNKTKITEAPLKQTIKATQVQPVQGEIFDINGDGFMDAVIYRQAFPQWDADLIYYVKHGRAPRLEKLVRFNSAPPTDLQVEFLIGFSDDTDIENVEERSVRVGGKNEIQRRKVAWDKVSKPAIRTKNALSVTKRGTTQKRGIGMKDFYIWDSGKPRLIAQSEGTQPMKKEKIDVDFERIEQMKYKMTKNVPASFFTDVIFPVFTDATDTFYPDPSVESTSVDGYVGDSTSGASWATAHDDTSGTDANDSGTLAVDICDQAAGASGYRIFRGIYLFDTSTLGAGATISAATFSINYDSISGGGHNDTSQSLGVVQSAPASNTAIVAGDMDGFTLHSDTLGAPALSVGSYPSAGSYADFALDATGRGWIAKTGITKLGVRRSPDYNDSTSHTLAPSGVTQSHRNWRTADYTGTTSDPKLVVTYTTATNVTVNPAVQVATFSLPAEAVKTGTTVSPAVQTATFSLPASSLILGNTVSPAAQVATFSLPTPTVLLPDVTVNVGVQTATFSLPAVTVKYDFVVSVGVQTATFSLPASSVGIGATISPSAQVATFSLPTATVKFGTAISVGVQTATFSIPAASITAQTLVSASVVTATFSTNAVTVGLGSVISAGVQVLTFIIPSLARFGGTWTKTPRATDATWSRSSRNSSES